MIPLTLFGKTMTPVFLDIDGVLQHTGSVVSRGQNFLSHSINPDRLVDCACPQSLALLLQLQARIPDIRWYIASSWCNTLHSERDSESLSRIFRSMGFLDVHLARRSRDRVERVEMELDAIGHSGPFVVIDDNPVFADSSLHENYVPVDSRCGFDFVAYEHACELLGLEAERVLW